ncbi:unknown protein [Desulfotalea psychrophila LSv54]|uniref:Uncharacterized protein n=1 Tax=Desulfotalea psychrophila (strain LSv54 / DSM 12343) TaxID=177439 RepID=Q6ARW4_DESPS|nr:unknown protein [Desulfotalea psychrophila LSv54]
MIYATRPQPTPISPLPRSFNAVTPFEVIDTRSGLLICSCRVLQCSHPFRGD